MPVNISNLPLVLTMNDIQNIERTSIMQLPQSPDQAADAETAETDQQMDQLPLIGDPGSSGSADSSGTALDQNEVEQDSEETLEKFAGSKITAGGLMKAGVGAVGAALEVTGHLTPDETAGGEKGSDKDKRSAERFNIKIISDITGRSTCEGTLKDFNRYVNNRFNTLKNIIRSQSRMFSRSMPIDRINMNYAREVHFIGMITDINTTKKGNTLVDMEDETGEVRVFINKDEKQLSMKLLNDEVIAVSGETNTKLGMIMAKHIIRPMPPRTRMVNRANDDVEAVFISDIHVGSTEFLEDNWNYFIQWLNGNVEIPDNITSEKVRYLVVAGDLVDGIGVYPGQQEELVITDINDQYRALADHLSGLRKDIKIILAPGNHDAVRPAEPQPALGEEFQQYFPDGTMFVGNPCYLSLHGVEILVYHGRSFDDIVKFVPNATYTNPISPMKEMMMRRHLVPIWGERTPIAPEHYDSLLIDRLPDIFITGHVHTAGCERVNDMLFINASSWQDQTSYQKTLNFNPDPCKAFLVNLHSVRGTELNFKNPNF